MSTELTALEGVSAQLAYDIASDLFPLEIVLLKHEVDEEAWRTIQTLPRFQELLEEAKQYWNGKDGPTRRIRAKATLMLEESLPSLYKIANDTDSPHGARLSAIGQMEKLSGVTAEDAAGGGGGPSFRISINLGEQTLRIAGSPTAKADDGDDEAAFITYDDVDYTHADIEEA